MSKGIDIDGISELMADLRMMARQLLTGERNAHSIRPTGLVMSALLRSLPNSETWADLTWDTREQFFSSMYRHMRFALIDHARKRNRAKRPQLIFVEPDTFDLYHLPATAETTPEVIIAMDEALDWLEKRSHKHFDVVNHHYFSGLTTDEISRLVGRSPKTIKRRLTEGRLLLHQKILELVNRNPV